MCSNFKKITIMFQSTHPHGVRQYQECALICEFEFQSTHPHGVRRGILTVPIAFNKVSIHAPARGATEQREDCHHRHVFQSTHPHGVRRDNLKRAYSNITVSIHAPARGATLSLPIYSNGALVSIHAPARGATYYRHYSRAKPLVSIHAPARGATTPFVKGWNVH